MRLLLPEGDHQFVNVAMAGVRTPRPSTKQGEPSEQWGEEVTYTYFIVSFYGMLIYDILGVGQILYRVEATSTTRSSNASLPTTIYRHSIPSRCIKYSSPSNVPDRQRYVLRSPFLPKNCLLCTIHGSPSPCWKHRRAPCRGWSRSCRRLARGYACQLGWYGTSPRR